jgi:thiamine-phosphate pyrophosphorylase
LIGQDRILGLSITSMADLDRSNLTGVDYLGVGPVFATATKPDAAPPMGLAALADIRERSSLPIVAIGGIDQANAGAIVGAGAHGVAVVSAVCAAPDPADAARRLAEAVASGRR